MKKISVSCLGILGLISTFMATAHPGHGPDSGSFSLGHYLTQPDHLVHYLTQPDHAGVIMLIMSGILAAALAWALVWVWVWVTRAVPASRWRNRQHRQTIP